jgi:uncharacterized protein Yka (UPF0111/DUF47 family)
MRRWFLPEVPDLLGLLTRQGDVTVAGIEALCAWAKGDRSQEAEVRAREHEADRARREVLAAVKRAFVTPISPEDVYEIAGRMDKVLNSAKDLVREAELLNMDPDSAMADMSELVMLGVRDLVRALPELGGGPDRATEYADAAVHQQRALEHVYRRAMSSLLLVDEIREVTGRRELYRRYARMGDAVEAVADRIWYAVVKAS